MWNYYKYFGPGGWEGGLTPKCLCTTPKVQMGERKQGSERRWGAERETARHAKKEAGIQSNDLETTQRENCEKWLSQRSKRTAARIIKEMPRRKHDTNLGKSLVHTQAQLSRENWKNVLLGLQTKEEIMKELRIWEKAKTRLEGKYKHTGH